MWDSSAGTEVASFKTGHGLSHIQIESSSQMLHVGHSNGIVTTWPLALGRHVAFLPEHDLRSSLEDGFSHSNGKLDPTSLTRSISVMSKLGDSLLIGFANGDLQLVTIAGNKISNIYGWRVCQSKIEIVGAFDNSDFFETTSASNWVNIIDEEDMEVGSLSPADSSDDLADWGEIPSSNALLESYERKVKTKNVLLWVAAGSKAFVKYQNDPSLTFNLASINSNVVDITMCNNILLVFSESGMMNCYDGKIIRRTGDQLNPLKSVNSKHGKLTGVHVDDTYLYTTGADRKIRKWSKDGLDLVDESKEPFLSSPVGISLHSSKPVLLMASDDGSLAIVKSTDGFTDSKLLEGNGHGIKKINHCANLILVHHTDGLVSLWTENGSEISQYNQRYSASLLSHNTSGQLDLHLANNNIEVLCPTESECVSRYSGHQGPLTQVIIPSPGSILTAGRDGVVKRWFVQPKAASSLVSDEIVAVILTPKMLSLSKAGVLTHWEQTEGRIEARNQTQLPQSKYRLMNLVEDDDGTLWMVTCSGLGCIKVHKLDIRHNHLEALVVLNTDVDLSQRVHHMKSCVIMEGQEKEQKINSKYQFSVLISTDFTSYVYQLRIMTTGRHWFNIDRVFENERTHTFEVPFNQINKEYLNMMKGKLNKLTTTSYLWREEGERVFIECPEDGGLNIMDEFTESSISSHAHDKIVTDVKQVNEDIFTCSEDGKIKLWKIKEDQMMQVGEYQGKGPGFSCLEFSEDGGKVMAGDSAGGVFFFSIIS